MREEIEIKYLSILYNSNQFTKKLFGTVGGCKSDFSRLCGLSESDYKFRQWLKKLIELKILEKIGKRDGITLYFINKENILKFSRQSELYLKIRKIAYADFTST